MQVVFYLNRERRARREQQPPDVTVLEYLRASGMTGSKEGCASGDCGACTAVVCALDSGGKPAFRAFNSCIALMPSVHGKWLITIEGLKNNNRLHPAQEAMVKTHGSQCGFCTPGFVMSLFAFGKSGADNPSYEDATTAVSGNLCRCTGYRPIIRAAMTMAKNDDDGYAIKTAKQKLGELQKAAPPDTLSLTAAQIADNVLRRPLIVAGGTDLALTITQQLQSIPQPAVIDNAPELATIREQKNGWHIGAAANWESVQKTLGKKLPSLDELIHRFGSPQIRYQGTVGGNIANASPVADGPPPFIALGAHLILRRGKQKRQMPLESFFISYKKTALRRGEWIESVFVPKPAADGVFRVYKISKRFDDDISALLLALYLRRKNDKITSAVVVAGGMAETPRRAFCTERALCGKEWSMQTFAEAGDALAKDFSPVNDARASKQYRMRAAANLLLRFANETT
ncbi:MAG: xanthine dehydrogenase small subunit [Gammaproteobacteria bacterium]